MGVHLRECLSSQERETLNYQVWIFPYPMTGKRCSQRGMRAEGAEGRGQRGEGRGHEAERARVARPRSTCYGGQ